MIEPLFITQNFPQGDTRWLKKGEMRRKTHSSKGAGVSLAPSMRLIPMTRTVLLTLKTDYFHIFFYNTQGYNNLAKQNKQNLPAIYTDDQVATGIPISVFLYVIGFFLLQAKRKLVSVCME